MPKAWRLRVPASSANLGPGFDSLGLALRAYLTCEFAPSEALTISVRGRDAESISTGTDNLIWQTALRVAEHMQMALPAIRLSMENGIPLGKGLGSSAAALTAGVVIADQLLGLHWKRPRILDEAARYEGHPDNVAACVYGAMAASAFDSHKVARAVRLEWPEQFGATVVIPSFALPTKEARAVLPERYTRAEATFNLQRTALLVAALATGARDAFPTALEDCVHQPHRAPLIPGLEEILRLRAPGLLGCCLSGAGPSVLVLHEAGHEAVALHVQQIFAAHGQSSELLSAGPDRLGFQLEEIA